MGSYFRTKVNGEDTEAILVDRFQSRENHIHNTILTFKDGKPDKVHFLIDDGGDDCRGWNMDLRFASRMIQALSHAISLYGDCLNDPGWFEREREAAMLKEQETKTGEP